MSEENNQNTVEERDEMTHREEEGEAPVRPKLNILNFFNVFSFIANVVIINIVGTLGIIDLPTNGEISATYQVSC